MSAKGTHWKASDETKKRMSESKKKTKGYWKDKYHSKETKVKLSIINMGKIPSEETKEKISLALKKYWSNKKRIISPETRNKQSLIMKGRHCSPLTEFKKGLPKELHPRWDGGKSFKPYCHKFDDELKEKIRSRDNYTCQLCDKIWVVGKEKLSIHHVHYDKENCKPDLITLCRSCNAKVNTNRDYYEKLFINKLKNKGVTV